MAQVPPRPDSAALEAPIATTFALSAAQTTLARSLPLPGRLVSGSP